MSVKSFFRKVLWYQKKHGTVHLIKLFLERNWQRFNKKEFMYLLDLKTMSVDNSILRGNISVESYSSQEDIPSKEMEQLVKLKSIEILRPALRSFFDRCATLWLAKQDDKPVSLCWTITGGFKGYYSGLHVWHDEAIILAVETFSKFRGHNYCPIMIDLICERLKEGGISRVYIGTHIKNNPMQRSLSKTNAKRIGAVRYCGILKWYIVIWDKNSLMIDCN